MRHNDARGWGTITNDILKFRKVIEFERSCIAISFSYIYLIIDGKVNFSFKKADQKLKPWAGIPIAVSSCPAAAHMYR